MPTPRGTKPPLLAGAPSWYAGLSSVFGTLYILWRETGTGPQVRRVFLPDERISVGNLPQGTWNGLPRSCPAIDGLAERIARFLAGEPVAFELDLIALDGCSDFQRRVLLAEHGIPRGWVSTYGRIARACGFPGAARAVGRALASNPFPIIIPCHRAIRSNGELGGYQGGRRMKQTLLEMEGVEFSRPGKVRMSRVYY